jgi:hypothetical protein
MCEKEKNVKYLDSLLTNEIPIQEEMKCRLDAGNSCCLVETLLPSKDLKIKIIKH